MKNFEKWTPPAFATDKNAIKQVEKQKLEYQKEFENGYQTGLEQGLLDAQSRAMTKEAELGKLMIRLNSELQNMTQALAKPMLGLVQTLVAHLLHEAHCLEPAMIAKSIQAALTHVGDKAGPITVLLHPTHYQCVLSYLENNPYVLDKIQLKATDAIQIGGCHVDAPQFFYDNSLDTQLKNCIEDLLLQLPTTTLESKAS